jgi:hypothetical protein
MSRKQLEDSYNARHVNPMTQTDRDIAERFGERRITAQGIEGRKPDALKEIAGRVQHLSYRDMVALSDSLNKEVPGSVTPEALLRWAEGIFAK